MSHVTGQRRLIGHAEWSGRTGTGVFGHIHRAVTSTSAHLNGVGEEEPSWCNEGSQTPSPRPGRLPCLLERQVAAAPLVLRARPGPRPASAPAAKTASAAVASPTKRPTPPAAPSAVPT